MKDLFWIDEEICKTYSDFIEDLKDLYSMTQEQGSYKTFLGIVASLVPNGANSYDDLLTQVKKNNRTLTLQTSGTTGTPKTVKHTLKNLTRNVRSGVRYKDNIWAFAYNPTHFAGLQVFFQALFNRNPMIDTFHCEKEKVPFLIREHQVTHISATPTYYRTVLPYFSEENRTVRNLTMGGEKFDGDLIEMIQKIFPNARIRNIYASTEGGSLFQSNGELFEIREEQKEHIRVDSNGELLIHTSLMGDLETFQEEWYHTGDIVAWEDDEKFRFVSRESEWINVGGYKVNPHEIEEAIKEVNGVQDVMIKARQNRITGSILTAEVVLHSPNDKNQMETTIKECLSRKFQLWKIPRIFHFVPELKKTTTGKKLRR